MPHHYIPVKLSPGAKILVFFKNLSAIGCNMLFYPYLRYTEHADPTCHDENSKTRSLIAGRPLVAANAAKQPGRALPFDGKILSGPLSLRFKIYQGRRFGTRLYPGGLYQSLG